MARIVELTTHLECSPDEAWARVHTTALLSHITWPLIRFIPRKATPWLEQWQEREYRAWMLLFGFIPLGWQAIVISVPEPRGEMRLLRDNGYSPLIKRWDHWIEIEPCPSGDGTRYTDRVTVEAGLLTPLVAAFARLFYTHRQRRWRALAASRFAALKR